MNSSVITVIGVTASFGVIGLKNVQAPNIIAACMALCLACEVSHG